MADVKGTLFLAALEKSVISGEASHRRQMHDALLAHLRNGRNGAPDWDAYPVGRDYWLQHWQ